MGRCRINNNFPVSSSRGLQTVRRCQYWKSQASWERSNLIRPKYLREYFLFTTIWIAWPWLWLDTFPIAIIYKGGSNYNYFYSQIHFKNFAQSTSNKSFLPGMHLCGFRQHIVFFLPCSLGCFLWCGVYITALASCAESVFEQGIY